jgi:type 1 glutamine amidotransferase
MLKKLFILTLILVPFIGVAQNKTPIPIPMKNGIIWYQKSYPIKKDLKRPELTKIAMSWFKDNFPNENMTADNSQELEGTCIFKIATGASGNYYWLKFKLTITPSDSSYIFRAYNVYEKPIERGITNEYSKLEYRWWDFRNGKPWSADDEPLFKGLDADMNTLMASLEKQIAFTQAPKFKAIAFYSTNVESDHVDFAYDAIKFYTKLAAEKGFVLDTTSKWENLNDVNLKNYKLVIWLNEFPHNEAERRSFERFMTSGGAWLGFHVSGYNDKDTHWPWFVDFMGGAVFYNNNWPPLPAKMIVNDNTHPATKDLPLNYIAPINEWYGWKPNPRDNKDVKVLVTLDPANYPLGKKDVIRSGDIPVVWTNTKYKMLYMNMGHGDQNFASPLQNKMFEDAILWLGK